MTIYKRTLLITLTFITAIFVGYQFYLIVYPLTKINTDLQYVHLVDQYQMMKMQRLMLEEQYAFAKTKEKIITLASNLQDRRQEDSLLTHPFKYDTNLLTKNFSAARVQFSRPHPLNIGLSIQEAKTFEQLEAYVNSKPLQPQATTKDEKYLLEMPANDFTLQLMGVRDKNELVRFVNENQLQDGHIFHTYYLNKDWYVLVYGRYANHTEALKAIDTLPTSLKELKPWIRQLSSVQKAIQFYR